MGRPCASIDLARHIVTRVVSDGDRARFAEVCFAARSDATACVWPLRPGGALRLQSLWSASPRKGPSVVYVPSEAVTSTASTSALPPVRRHRVRWLGWGTPCIFARAAPQRPIGIRSPDGPPTAVACLFFPRAVSGAGGCVSLLPSFPSHACPCDSTWLCGPTPQSGWPRLSLQHSVSGLRRTPIRIGGVRWQPVLMC